MPGAVMPSSDSSTFLPDAWLRGHALDEGVQAAAYERVGGQGRASLKKCIARLYRIWGQDNASEEHSRCFCEGFGLRTRSAPAAFAIVACECGCPSPAAFLAALMPAILAGVGAVHPCFLSSGSAQTATPAAPLLAALELAGLEQSYAASENSLLKAMEAGRAGAGEGRLVLLGGRGFGEGPALFALRAGMPVQSLTPPPDNAAGERDEGAPFLSLDGAHEDVWVWPSLPPDWFRTKRMALFAL